MAVSALGALTHSCDAGWEPGLAAAGRVFLEKACCAGAAAAPRSRQLAPSAKQGKAAAGRVYETRAGEP